MIDPNRRSMLANALGGPQQAASSVPSGATAPSPGFGGLGMQVPPSMPVGGPVGAAPSNPMGMQMMGQQPQIPGGMQQMMNRRLPYPPSGGGLGY